MKRTPEETLRRVLKVSRLDGWSVAIFAGFCSLVSLAFGDPVGCSVGLLVALGGALEVRGHHLLKHGNADGMRWLVRSQLVVLGTIWAYAASRLLSFDTAIVQDIATPDMRASLNELGLTLEDILPLVRRAFYLLYGGVMAVTLIYQGGLALYYRRRTAAVAQALSAPLPVTAPFSTP
jgi:hypothetical protein